MLTYPCMEESCVCTVPASHLIVPLHYEQCRELTVELSKRKKTKESKHPQLTVAFYLHCFKWMNEWLFTCGKKVWGRLKDMKEKWNAERKTNLVVKFVPSTRGKNCAIFICPYRETAVASIPAIDLNPREQIKQISTPQIITKVHNLARLRRLTVS